jgi:hypothetical protein
MDTLFVYLQRVKPHERRAYIWQTEAYLVLSAVIASVLFIACRMSLSEGLGRVAGLGVWLVLFTMLWSWSQVLDRLPTVDERIGWQVGISMTVSVVRAAHGERGLAHAQRVRGHRMAHRAGGDQGLHPLGLHPALPPVGRAPLGLAAIQGPCRAGHSVRAGRDALPLPRTGRAVAGGGALQRRAVRGVFHRLSSTVIQLNNSVNIAVAAVLFPLLSYVQFYAGPLVELVYTSKMIDAAPVMRIMVLACALQVVDLNSLSLLLKQGKFTTALNGALLAVAVPLSWWGRITGDCSALLGSTVAIYAERILLARRLAREMNRPVRQLQPWGLLGYRPRSPWRPARCRTSWLSACTSVRCCGH